MKKISLIILSLVCAAVILMGFNNVILNRWYKHDYVKSIGSTSKTNYLSGTDTLLSDTFLVAGWPYLSQSWYISQANDSISCNCSLYSTIDTATDGSAEYFIMHNTINSKAYAGLSFSAPDTGGRMIPIPFIYKAYWKCLSDSNNGDSAIYIFPFGRAPIQ